MFSFHYSHKFYETHTIKRQKHIEVYEYFFKKQNVKKGKNN